ncbi:MAG: M15 family metallopeptidase [Bacillota bacterium]|nr:M15 family metallopeptidase [Bacillota bacterium]
MTRKRRRLRKIKLPKINLPKLKVKKKTGPRRRIRKSIIIIPLLAISLIFGLFYVPKMIDNGKLKDLGYSKEEITAIRELKLTKTILDNEWYSDYLAISIRDKSIKTEYIELYLVSSSLSDKEFLLYNRLIDKGYNKEQVLKLFKHLRFFEITPLLVFDYQEDVQVYIDDCIANKETNSEDYFVLSNNYYTHYQDAKPAPDPTNINMLVNKTYYVDASFEPVQIAPLSVQYAAKDLQLSAEAASALAQWCNKAISLKDEITGVSPVRFYAVSAYRSYERQETLYNNYVKAMGEEKADAVSARPGFSEHQTGLTVDLAAVGSEGLSAFKDTEAYNWVIANGADFGWILRYPEGKTSITGYDFEPWHYRYLGVDLAKKVVESKLTFDEYWMLYLAPWNNIENTYPKVSTEDSKTEEIKTEETQPEETQPEENNTEDSNT